MGEAKLPKTEVRQDLLQTFFFNHLLNKALSLIKHNVQNFQYNPARDLFYIDQVQGRATVQSSRAAPEILIAILRHPVEKLRSQLI